MSIGEFILYTYSDATSVRYVGKTSAARASERHRQHRHLALSGKSHHLYNWWRSLEHEPSMEIHSKHATEAEALSAEVDLITALREGGASLTNVTDGGEGTSGLRHSPESIERMRAAQSARTKQPNQGKRHTASARAKIAAAGRGREPWNKGKQVWSAEERARIGEQGRGRKQSPETVESRIKHQRGELNANARLTVDLVRYLRAEAAKGRSAYALAREIGVNTSTAHRAIIGQTWKVI